MFSLAHSVGDDTGTINKFRELVYEVVRLGRIANVEIRPFRSPGLSYFSRLESSEKRKVLLRLEAFIAICEETLAEGKSLRDSKVFVWKAIKHFNLTPCSDLFSNISDEHVIEIYDTQNIQIFRNFRFFEYCSYTLEDIFCRPWTELFIRPDNNYLLRLLEIISSSFKSQEKRTLPGIAEEHIVEEMDSPLNYKLSYQIKNISPLFEKNHTPAGFVAIEEANILSQSGFAEPNIEVPEHLYTKPLQPSEL